MVQQRLRLFVFRLVFVWGGVLGFLWVSPVSAGPWSQAPGHFYTKLGQGIMFGRESVGPNGELGGGNFFGTSTQFYGELGIFYGLQIQAFVPFSLLRLSRGPDDFFQLTSFQDSIVGLQWTPPFLAEALGFPIALRFNVKVPLYDQQPLLDNPQTRAVIGRLPILGEGQLDFTTWLSAGGGIPKTALYLFGEVGYRVRSDIFVDQRLRDLGLEFLDTLMFNFQVGYNFFNRLVVMLNVNGAIPLGEDRITKGFVNLGIGFYLRLWKGLALELNVDQMVWYRAAPPVTSFALGVSYKF
ncbi:MAG: hypothetical protein AAGJ35_11345 [Myxococcota bacterium]